MDVCINIILNTPVIKTKPDVFRPADFLADVRPLSQSSQFWLCPETISVTHHRPGLACEMAENIDNPFGLQADQYQVIFAARALRPVLHAKSTPSVGQSYLAFACSTQVLPGQEPPSRPSPPPHLPRPNTRELLPRKFCSPWNQVCAV